MRLTGERRSSRTQVRQQVHEAITTVFKSTTLINALLGGGARLPGNSRCEGLRRKWWRGLEVRGGDVLYCTVDGGKKYEAQIQQKEMDCALFSFSLFFFFFSSMTHDTFSISHCFLLSSVAF